jgi:hypothetical protein
MKPANSTARLAHALDSLARLYQHRKLAGRPVDFLFPRCRRLSSAYLASLNSERSA